MKTFVISAVIATMASTASFAAVDDVIGNGYGKELTVVQQQTGASGNTRVVLENDRGQERMFTVKKNGKVRGKGGKKLKANIAAMVAADLEAVREAEPRSKDILHTGPGKKMNLVDCRLTDSGVDRIVEISHETIKIGIKAQRDFIEIACAE